MIGVRGTLDGPPVEVSRRRRAPRPGGTPRDWADAILGVLKAARLSGSEAHEVIQLLPGSLRSTERALSRTPPLACPGAAGDD